MRIDKHIFRKHIQIAERYESRFGPQNGYDRMRLFMDLESLHELDCESLLSANDQDFGHDVSGITKYMDRSTFPGRLAKWFEPRCGWIKKTANENH